MAWDLDSDRPIYLQLVDRIQMQIVSGQYPPGVKLPSVRELAVEAADYRREICLRKSRLRADCKILPNA